MSRTDLEKGLTEAVRHVLKANIDTKITNCRDASELGQLLQEKNKLGSFRITIS